MNKARKKKRRKKKSRNFPPLTPPTSKGIMSDRDARSANTGGELLALVW
jgi:ribosomal protein S8